MYTTYVLYNETANKIYIGQTQNLEVRIKRHNGELLHDKSSFTAKNKGEWVLIYKEEYQSRRESMIRERQLKSQKGRDFIWNMIT